MNNTQLPRVASMINNTPLMVTSEVLESYLAVLGKRIYVDSSELSNSNEEVSLVNPYMIGSIRVIPITGAMGHKIGDIEAMSGVNSYSKIQANIEDAVKDISVSSIILDWDSGGGTVAGAFDAYDNLMSLRGTKPIYSISNDSMYSAAYLLGSTADKVYMTQTAGVGSIGVIASRLDLSEKNSKDGIKPHIIKAGAFKGLGNPNEPMTDKELEVLQESVNESYEQFVDAVSISRGLDKGAIKDTEAMTYRHKKAIRIGLADGVATIDKLVSESASTAKRVYVGATIDTKGTGMANGNKLVEADIEGVTAEAVGKLITETEMNEKIQFLNESLKERGLEIDANGNIKELPKEEMIVLDGIEIPKASIPKELVTKIEALNAKQEEDSIKAEAQEKLPNLALEEGIVLTKILRGLEGEEKAIAEKTFAKFNSTLEGAFVEIGSKGVSANSPREVYDQALKAYAEEKGFKNMSEASAEFNETAEGKPLINAVLKGGN